MRSVATQDLVSHQLPRPLSRDCNWPGLLGWLVLTKFGKLMIFTAVGHGWTSFLSDEEL